MAEETLPTPRTRKPRTKTVAAPVSDAGEVVMPPKPRARRAPAKKTVAPATEATEAVGPTRPATRTRARKAPTPIAETRVVTKRKHTLRYVSIALLVLSLGASATIGLSAEGEINVRSSMATQLAESPTTDTGEAITVAVPPSSEPVIDSGLIASNDQSVTPPPPPATTTATTTDESATSSEATTPESTETDTTAGEGDGAVAGATATAMTEETQAVTSDSLPTTQ